MKKRMMIQVFTLLVGGVNFLYPKAMPVAAVERGVRMSGYTTYYDEKVVGRSENIRLSASFIDGIVVQAYGEFSFNQTVGERTKERGFKEAKVIAGGRFVDGIGGGVCQVSTTLYNAAVYAGLEIVEYHAHSLAVGYVPPSQDAMVSAFCDLRLYNPYEFAVRVEVKAEDGAVRARFYGKETGLRRSISSKVVGKKAPPAPLIVSGEREEVLREGREGTDSESYLEIYRAGALLERKLLRRDSYAPTQAIIVKKTD